jgi:hypothetical protein
VCALENAVDGVGRRVERLADLRGGEAEDVAKDQRRPLPRRQVLERCDERQLDALALLVACVGRGEPTVRFVGRIGVRLQPGRFGERRRGAIVRISGRPVVDRQHALGAALDQLQADVRRDPVEPGAERASALEPGQSSPRPQECVLGILDRAEHPVAMGEERSAVGLDDRLEGDLIALPGRFDQSTFGNADRCGGVTHLFLTTKTPPAPEIHRSA